MSDRTIRVCFDFLSPYAYLAWNALPALAARHGVEVEPVPVLFAALLDAWGQKGPAEIPPKRVYVFKDVLRHAHALGVPFGAPPSHPFNPLLALRAASLDMPADTRRAFVTALFREVWGGGRGVDAPAVVSEVASSVGLDGAAVVRAAQEPEVKVRLREQTDAAIGAGVFGVPSMLVGAEVFWGYDSLAHLERFLVGDDPATPERLAGWAGITPTAVRPSPRPPPAQSAGGGASK